MAYRPGGVDPDEIRVAFESLQGVRSAQELGQLIDTLPVLSTPIFHARLRSELHRQIDEHGEPHPHFIQVYDYLFASLHHRIHARLVESARPPAEAPTRPGPVEVFAPPYFLRLTAELGGQLPKAEGPTLNPANDAAEIRAEIEAVVGRGVDLPEHEPSASSHWSTVLVACASCRHVRLKVCAYGIDLSQSPALVEPLRDGRLNNFDCPTCSGVLCFPLRVWVQDGPGAGDELAALSCAWRLSDSKFIYQVPPGTPKVEQNNYVLEVRFDKLLQRLGWRHIQAPADESPKVTHLSFAVAYSTNEVSEYIRRMTDAEPTIPFAMEIMILELTRKLKSGLLPIYDVVDHIRQTVGAAAQDWPVVVPENLRASSRDPHNYLVLCLTAEAAAEARKCSHAERALLAARTFSGFFSMGKVALAEAALARAEDFLKKAQVSDPAYSASTLGIEEARSHLFSFIGRHAEADQARGQVGSSPLLAGDTLTLRLIRQHLKSQEALSLKRQGRLAEALKMFPESISTLELIESDAASSEEDPNGNLALIRHQLSGDLANCAAVLITLGEYLETVDKLKELIAGGAEPEEAARQLESNGMEPDDLLVARDAIQVLQQMYPSGFTPETLFEDGRQLLVRALELSEGGQGWEFAGIQAHRLAGLLHDHLNEPEAAQEMMLKAIDYASRVGDHVRVSTGHFFLANLAINQDDGPKALEHLLVSAREEIKQQVGSGYYARPKGMRLGLSDAAMRAASLGGDPRVAIIIAESLKVPTTAATMLSGLPLRPGATGEHLDGEILNELLSRRESLRIEISRGREDDAGVGEELRQIELKIETEHKASSLLDLRFTRWVDATNLDVSDLYSLLRRLRRLGPRTTLLGILPIGRTVWTYAVWDDGCLLSEQSLPMFDGQPPPDFVGPSESREVWEPEYLEQLAVALLEPLGARLSELGPADRLIISTSDPLALVPFSALPYKGSPLCEHVCISQTQGVGMLEACLDRADSNFNSVLCVGNPSRPDLEDLPEAHREAVTVAGRFRESGKQSVLLAWDEATVPNLKVEAERYDVLHFACHADVATAPGEQSSLMLAPDLNAQDSGDFSEDRILSELTLRKGGLVNLAGCQTGVQNSFRGFLLGGLVPTFLIAGAGSVIGSLWDLDDGGAATFQIEFYRLLLSGRSAAESLAETQRACLRGEFGPAMRDVRMWAGYALYGVG